MSRQLGPENDLSTIKILLEIDDEQFIKACQTSKYMYELCKRQDIWRDRINIFYPDQMEYINEIPNLAYSEAYPVLVMLKNRKFRKLLNYLVDYDEAAQLIIQTNISYSLNVYEDLRLSLIDQYLEVKKFDMLKYFDERDILNSLSLSDKKWRDVPVDILFELIKNDQSLLYFYANILMYIDDETNKKFIVRLNNLNESQIFISNIQAGNGRIAKWMIDELNYDYKKDLRNISVLSNPEMVIFMLKYNIKPNFEYLLKRLEDDKKIIQIISQFKLFEIYPTKETHIEKLKSYGIRF